MAHGSNIVLCEGPDSAHAFDIVPLQPRNGSLDAMCPKCAGHGEWNTEIDLVSFRCKRAICDRCYGAGWVETGNDPVGLPDIELATSTVPKWTTRYLTPEEADEQDTSGPLASP
jgi:hypothetical protein